MKQFLIKCGLFFGIGFSVLLTLAIVTAQLVGYFLDYQIPTQKNILVIGDSLPTNAINDNIVDNVFNLAHHSTSYFHSFIKIKKLVEKNPQIDTLVLGYHYFSFEASRNEWFNGETYLKRSLKNYFNLMTFKDYNTLFLTNPLQVLYYTIPSIGENLSLICNSDRPLTSLEIGGHFGYDRTTPAEEIPLKTYDYNNPAKQEVIYIKEIYAYCKAKGIQLILLFPPITPKQEQAARDQLPAYCQFALEQLPAASLVNHSTLDIGPTGFLDLIHLNESGAQKYSNYLKKHGFIANEQTCKF